jgi:hypothetical protein
MAMVENGKVYGIAYTDIKKQSTSWLKGVKKALADAREAGEEIADYEMILKEVNEELEKRLATSTPAESSVTRLEPEKMREGR